MDFMEKHRAEEAARINWLRNLKVGDEVAVRYSGGFHEPRYTFHKLERMTNTQLVVAGRRFRRDSGNEIGRHYDYQLVAPTEELKNSLAEKERRRKLLVGVKTVNWITLPNDALEQVMAIVSASADKEEPS